MRIYKELSFVGNKEALDNFKKIVQSFSSENWKYLSSDTMRDYIVFDYLGDEAEPSKVFIYYGADTWRKGYIKVSNIIPLKKNQLTIDEYNTVLNLFYVEIIAPNINKLEGLKIVGPESDVFDPRKYISDEALKKLTLFCNLANKTTGSSHPSDEERWFDFICQTVDDNQVFDYDTLFRFLMDEEYWGKKDADFIGVMGQFAWNEENAGELALEYENYVRILQFYKDKKF